MGTPLTWQEGTGVQEPASLKTPHKGGQLHAERPTERLKVTKPHLWDGETRLTSSHGKVLQTRVKYANRHVNSQLGSPRGRETLEAEIEVLTNRAGSTWAEAQPLAGARWPSVCMFVCLHISVHMCICVSLGLCVCISVSVCLSGCVHLCMFVTVCVCVYICVSHCLCMNVSGPGVPAVQGGTPVWSLQPTQGREEATDPTGKEPAPQRGLWEKYMSPIKLIDHTSM